jgi:hypothetical protein
MKRITFGRAVLWDTLLVASVIFAAFIMPVLPHVWQRSSFLAVYNIIYVAAIFSLEKRSNYTLLLFAATILLAWISSILNLQVLSTISRGVNILYFLVIVASLIKQIASAREVTSGVILTSIAGYLLMGLIFSIFIAFLMQQDPTAFTPVHAEEAGPVEALNVSVPLYFSFVTMASLGYGDVLPLKPYTRSLATFIVVSGQFYIAIIVALLVGKFTAQQHRRNDNMEGG